MRKQSIWHGSKKKLWALYRPIQWYLYGAEHYPELGFSTAYASILETMSIPGNPKGEAVRIEDPDSGPLNHSLELPLLIQALKKIRVRNLNIYKKRLLLLFQLLMVEIQLI